MLQDDRSAVYAWLDDNNFKSASYMAWLYVFLSLHIVLQPFWERLPLASRKVNTDLAVLGFRSSSSVPFLVGDGCAWNGRKPTTRELRSFSCLPWSAIDFHQTNKNPTRALHAKARHHEMFVSALHTLGLSLDDWTVHDAEQWLCETRKVFENSRHAAELKDGLRV